MAFLDNSGDIILDAVLTDIGRKRLAAGNFVITKFALGDEEINYSLWNSTDPRGSAFYDLQIMQTPLMEALTSDQAIMKSRLMTLSDNSVVYLPVLRLNDKVSGNRPKSDYPGFYLFADSRTYDVNNNADATAPIPGVILGVPNRDPVGGATTHIAIDQGMITGDSGLTVADPLPGGLLESDYIVKVDRRLIHLHGFTDNGVMRMDHQSIDDDGIATYYVVRSNNGPVTVPGENIEGRIRQQINDGQLNDPEDLANFEAYEMFQGPLGSVLRLTPKCSPGVTRSETLFDEFGQLSTVPLQWRGATIKKHKYIDTTISISGARTGCSIDVPIRIIKGTDFTQS